ncbi:MAG: VWA domain-containing protein [Luteitalea sp.]|nr:VWA domain-containing protein [Luteitalea sp.]
MTMASTNDSPSEASSPTARQSLGRSMVCAIRAPCRRRMARRRPRADLRWAARLLSGAGSAWPSPPAAPRAARCHPAAALPHSPALWPRSTRPWPAPAHPRAADPSSRRLRRTPPGSQRPRAPAVRQSLSISSPPRKTGNGAERGSRPLSRCRPGRDPLNYTEETGLFASGMLEASQRAAPERSLIMHTLDLVCHHRPVLVITLALAAGLSLPSTALTQPDERALYVSVLNKRNEPVTTLGRDDLIVREDGVAREVLRLSRATQPLQIALLVDNSQAAERDMLNLREGLTSFVDAITSDGKHELSLVTFGERPTIQLNPTRDVEALHSAVGRLFAVPGSGAYALEAIAATARGFARREATRPVIVLIVTEGVEFSNDHYQTVIDALKRSGAAFYALRLTEHGDADDQRDETRNRNIVLDRGTRETGGRQEILLTTMSVNDELETLAHELVNQYRVVYARPESLIPPERVTVEAKDKDLTARATPEREPRSGASR